MAVHSWQRFRRGEVITEPRLPYIALLWLHWRQEGVGLPADNLYRMPVNIALSLIELDREMSEQHVADIRNARIKAEAQATG